MVLTKMRSNPGFMGIIPLRCKLGEYYFLNLDDDAVAEYLFWFGSFGYERSSAVLFTHLSMQASCVLDLGSYSGYFSLLSSILAKNPNTYAVEANPLNYHRLCENMKINGAKMVPYNFALYPSSTYNETITICYNANLRVLDAGSFASHDMAELISQKMSKHNKFIVQAITFAELVSALSIPTEKRAASYVLIKLDVEGLELPILSDIIELLSNTEFIVFIEILTSASYQQILGLVDSRGDFCVAYIDEYSQKVTLNNDSEYTRTKGSRNFIFGTKSLVQEIVSLSPSELLAKYE
jgi:FkbM family methyltransferase